MRFTDLLQSLSVPHATEGHEHCRPGWVQFDCPFCSRNSHWFRMGYRLDRGYVSCWACGGKPLQATVAELARCTWREAGKLLDGLDSRERRPVGVPAAAKAGRLVLPDGLGPLNEAQMAYLRGRSRNPEQLVSLWHLQGISRTATALRWRIFIPVEYKGACVSWTTRSISEKPGVLRYVSASEDQELVPHKDLLFGEDLVPGRAIVITEGPFDAMNVGPGGVALFGTAYRRAQLLRLSRYTTRCVCFDSDKPGQKRAKQLMSELSPFPGETLNIELDAKDPGKASAKEIKQLRAEVGLT